MASEHWLPSIDVDPSKVTAEFKSGVLKVKLPKPEEAQKQSKRIEIKTS